MRKRRIVAAAGLVLVTLAVAALAIVLVQARRTPWGRPDYVALGSSFAAGAGLGRLEPGSPWLCARSVGGYPQRLAARLRVSLVDMSCGGAVTRHLLAGGQYFQGSQIRTITPETRLVTITVGGNDIGYIGDLSMLAARRTGTLFGRLVRAFWAGPRREQTRGYDQLRADLTATVRAVRAAAPSARIVLATYPAILPSAGTCARIGLSADEAQAMRGVAARLAAITRSVAAAAGAVTVDMDRLGAGHDACAADPWTRGWTNGAIAPFHPTARGAQATADAIATALGS